MKNKLTFFDIVKTEYEIMKEKLQDYADFSFDEKLTIQIDDLKYLPWIGKDFEKERTLIVGESLYLWKDKNRSQEEIEKEATDISFLRKTVSSQGLLLIKDKKKHVFYRNIERLLKGKKEILQDERLEIWTSVAFHQFVQFPMKSLKHRPTKIQYEEGARLLKEICDFLDVKHCIFLGSDYSKFQLIKEVYGADNFELIDREKIGTTFGRKRIATYNGRKTLFTFVKHPSAFFRWREWYDFQKKKGNGI